jgi:acyl-CoA synthetase (NDP forming)
MLKVGRSAYGVAAVRSHTAAMAGESAVNSAVFRQLGVIEVEDTDELMDVASILTRWQPPERTRIAVFGGSGGASALAADHIGAAGLELAQLEPSTRRALSQILPGFASVANPIDTTAAAISQPEIFEQALEIVARDPNVDLVVLPQPLDYGEFSAQECASYVRAQRSVDIPLIPLWMSDRRGPGWKALAEGGMPPTRSLSKGILAVKRWAWYGKWRAEYDRGAPPMPLMLMPAATDTPTLPDVSTEHAAKQWLAGFGLPIPSGTLARSDADAERAGRAHGTTVAKVSSPDIEHKSDVGGVRIGITGAACAVEARRDILEEIARRRPDARVDGILFEEQAPDDGIDMIVGVHRDPTFGHVLSVGLGGVYVEIMNDVQLALLPVGKATASSMLEALRSWPLLNGSRGREPVDVAGLAELIARVSEVVSIYRDALDTLELNPVRVRPTSVDGASVIVLDALVVPAGDPAGGAVRVAS